MTAISTISPALRLIASQLMHNEGASTACERLAFAIFLRTSDISAQIAECLPNINTKLTSAKVTPLHIAAMTGDKSAMTQLQKSGADLNANDFNRYTPLHHAAMAGNQNGVEHLLSLGANPKRTTQTGATYADLLRFTSPQADLSAHASLFSAHKKASHRIESQCVPAGVQVIDELVAKPEALVDIWKRTSYPLPGSAVNGHLGPLHNENLENYRAFKENPPNLAVKPLSNLEGQKNCGLFAEQDIEAGQFIAEYTGELITPDQQTSVDPEYLWIDYPPIDAGKQRSVAAMANDGFPNAQVIHLRKHTSSQSGLDGLPLRKFLVALEKISAGDQITINYGASHEIKHNGAHKELNLDAVKKYFSTHSLNADGVVEKMNSPRSSLDAKREAANLITKSSYLLQTPNTMRWIAEQGFISMRDIQSIRNLGPALANHPTLDLAEKALKKNDSSGNVFLAAVGGIVGGLAAAILGTRLVYPRQ